MERRVHAAFGLNPGPLAHLDPAQIVARGLELITDAGISPDEGGSGRFAKLVTSKEQLKRWWPLSVVALLEGSRAGTAAILFVGLLLIRNQ